MKDFKIDKGIPLPDMAQGNHSRKGNGFKGLLCSMEVGDSVFRQGWSCARASGSVAPAKKESGFTFATRRVDGGVRIWRVS